MIFFQEFPMPLKCLAFLAVTLALGSGACSSPQDEKVGAPESLAVKLIVDTSDDLFEDWRAFGKSIGEAEAEVPIYIGCVVSGFGVNERGVANLRVDLEVIQPTGELLHRQDNFAVYSRVPEPGAGAVLADTMFHLTFESSDPEGDYTIRAIATDLVTGETTEGRHQVTIAHS
jgi:hypothetical protein